jgi:hypothetical protein
MSAQERRGQQGRFFIAMPFSWRPVADRANPG